MIYSLREMRVGRARYARLMLGVLAFIGSQVSFARAAFPHLSRSSIMRVVEVDADAPSQSIVDSPRLPLRGGRRGGPTVGPSAPIRPEPGASLIRIRRADDFPRQHIPPSFVPPPPFHPPRAH